MNNSKNKEQEDSSFLLNDDMPEFDQMNMRLNSYGSPDANKEVIVIREVVVVSVGDDGANVINSIIALAIVFVGTQIASALWKRYHKKSFAAVSVSTLLFFPFVTGILARSYVFIAIWLAIAFVHLVVFRDVLVGRRPKVLTTNVYNVYRVVFQASLIFSTISYILVAYGFFKEKKNMYKGGVVSLLYILYFTLIIRTCLDIISERASGTILPSKAAKIKGNICPMCQSEMNGDTITLGCKETFHKNCLKNWKILGKKDTCPSCKEKVNLSEIEMNPWQKNEYLFTKFLDFTGNLILAYAVIQGIILFL
ncbi:RING finger protein 121/175 [Nematocida minor]|uniref:RING finger protein 121/175 n=1 Tax=Nematocida minor TaxID=1912983 RepID=UPI00222068F6|nr:RING finger protein 121/175 [Nematocida minor]XP_051332090.1 RING finger protein 121/175 [Nematocida minor]KAI5188820.1 RING finger protein 121/175 [Nematocida minor]KAI5188924.1 RING finger protein 121/175 [Nematocida minor]